MYEMLTAFIVALFRDVVLLNTHKTSINQHCSSFKLMICRTVINQL